MHISQLPYAEVTSGDWFLIWRKGSSAPYLVQLPFERINYMLEKQDEMIESLTKQVNELTQQIQFLKEHKNG